MEPFRYVLSTILCHTMDRLCELIGFWFSLSYVNRKIISDESSIGMVYHATSLGYISISEFVNDSSLPRQAIKFK